MRNYSGDQTLNKASGCVTVIGGINVDIKGVSSESFIKDTSNPGTVTITPGGVGRNIAENLARLGLHTVLLGAVGSDSLGELILNQTSAAGVDVEKLILSSDKPTGRYLCVTDQQHETISAVSDMEITENVSARYLRTHEKIIARSDMLVLDANLPDETLEEAVNLAARSGVPVLMEPVSVQKSSRLNTLALHTTYLTPNALEYNSLTGIPPQAAMPNAIPWAETALVTLGREGVLKLKHEAGQNTRFRSPPVRIVDENGAGDAFTAGFVAGIVCGYSENEAVEAGIRIACFTLESPCTVHPGLDASLLM